MTLFHRSELGLDHQRSNGRHARQLRREAQTRRPGAGDQHVHRFGQRVTGAAMALRRGLHIGIAGVKTVDVVLHSVSIGPLDSRKLAAKNDIA